MAIDESDAAYLSYKVDVTTLEHVKLYRRMQSNFISYDAYARAGTTLGMNCILMSLWYFNLGLLIIEAKNEGQMAGWAATAVMAANVFLIAKLDFNIDSKLRIVITGLILGPAVCSAIAVSCYQYRHRLFFHFVLACYVFHIAWTAFMLFLTKADADA